MVNYKKNYLDYFFAIKYNILRNTVGYKRSL